MTTGGETGLRYLLEGPKDAPVLALSNSLGTSLEMWDPQAPALRERFRLLRYNTRGHGGAPAPPGPYAMEDFGWGVISLLDRLGMERASFRGLSVGGMTGVWLAAEAPERVDRLVLTCTSAPLGPKGAWDERIETATGRGMDALVDAVIERWFTLAFRSETPRIVEGTVRTLRETDHPRGYAAIRVMDLRDRLPSIKAPTLVVSAAENPATPPGHGEFIRNTIPGARFEVVPRASYIANAERPEKITELILTHLEAT